MRRGHYILACGSVAYFLSSLWFGIALAGSSGTTLSVSKTAVGTLTQTNTYSWSIQKTTPPNQVTYVLPPGQSVMVPFTITATRNGPVVTSTDKVSGNVCVTNTGLAPTIGLQITDTVEFLNGSVWQPVPGGQHAIPVSADLAAGASQCYPYQFNNLGLNPTLQYRNHAQIFIDNYIGHEGTSFPSDAIAPFTVTTTATPVDANATLSDALVCPTGLTCSGTTLPTNLTDSTVISYSVTVTNTSLSCGQTVTLLNTATLVQNDTHTASSASASAQIYTGACPVPAGPSLGAAASFAVLGGSTVTSTGASTLTGDLGVSPGTAITGFPPGTVNGTVHAGDAVALQAQSDVTAAYNNLVGRHCDTILSGQDLGGLTLNPGTYCFAATAALTGTLTLNAHGNPNAVFIFQIGSTLATSAGSSVLLVDGASACNVFWQIGSSSTLAANTTFSGNMLALSSIGLGANTSLNGRALARNAAITMDTDSVSNIGCTRSNE